MQNQQIVDLLRDVNNGFDLPERLKQVGIETEALPPRRRRRLINRVTFAAANFASAIARAGAELDSVNKTDDESWTVASEE